MTYIGSDLKFRITTTKDDFTLAGCPFCIVIKNSYGRVVKRIQKGDCFFDTEGQWYFNVENVKEGLHTAVFVGAYEDDDYAKQQRTWTDIQPLYNGSVCCCTTATDPHRCCEDHKVHYEQVWDVSIDGEDYLADRYGRYVYTSDGKRIMFKNQIIDDIEDMGKVKMKMTGEEFLKLMESKEPNSEINTIPELMDAMRGISDDETVQHDVDERIEAHDQENEASDEDIDSIFPD